MLTWIDNPFFRMFSVITLSMAAGWIASRRRWVPEKAAKGLMTILAVVLYPAVGALAIWQVRITQQDIWLPFLLVAHSFLMAAVALAVGRVVLSDRREIGLLALTGSAGNNGATMGGFVAYLIYGTAGLGLASIYFIAFNPVMVLLLYPIARHFSGSGGGSMAKLMLRSVFDWRAVGILLSIAGILLSVMQVPRPQVIGRWHIVDISVYLINVAAYFSIGLRIRPRLLGRLVKLAVALAGIRFIAGLAIGMGLMGLTLLTAWPLGPMRRTVVLIQAMVPTAVTCVAVANMFDLLPRQASALFVINTLCYLLFILPLVFLVFG